MQLIEIGMEVMAKETSHPGQPPMKNVIEFMAKDSNSNLAEIALRRLVSTVQTSMEAGHVRFLVDTVPNHFQLASSKLFNDIPKLLLKFERTELKANLAFLIQRQKPDGTDNVPKDANVDNGQKGDNPRMSVSEERVSVIVRKKAMADEACPERRARRSLLFTRIMQPLIRLYQDAQEVVTIRVPDTDEHIEPELYEKVDNIMSVVLPDVSGVTEDGARTASGAIQWGALAKLRKKT